MSRVIKSGQLKVESPRLINCNGPQLQPTASSAEVEDQQPDIMESPPDLAQVSRQAEEIIRETEEMVKDLLGTARQEAEKIIKNAREQAESLIRDGQERVNEVNQQGYNEGWQVGYGEGTKKAEEEMKGTLMAAQKTLQDAQAERERIIMEAEDEIIQLAINIAQKIICTEVSAKQDLIVDIVKKAMEKVRDREEISLRVNPDNIDSIINSKEEIIASTKGIRKMKVLTDPDVTPGGCVIETANGTVDARVERQLKEIEQSLLEVNANG